jgi:uncharacterized protein DUF4307
VTPPSMATAQGRPPERYGASRPWARWLSVALVVALGLSGSAWLLWAALYHAGPQISASLLRFSVVGRHRLRVEVQIDRGEIAPVVCRVTAETADSSIVGDRTFAVPARGAAAVTVSRVIVTERPAANATLQGCTATSPGAG